MDKLMQLRIEGPAVIVLDGDGKAVFNLPWDAALIAGQAFIQAGRKAEENAKTANIVFDQAFLTRAAAPFGLTDNRKIIEEARKEAAHNSELRKLIPETPDDRSGGLGVPSVVKP